jgi:SMODS and SLOG-associating 2TM effector domain 1
MDNRHGQFLNLYQTYRHKDQAGFYQARCMEFERARRQAIITAGVLMLLTTMVSIFTATGLFWPKWVWAALGVFLPALSTALTAYNSLFGFEQQLKLYQDASRALHRAEADSYGLRQAVDEVDYPKRIEAYVKQVEEILHKEQGQWGQLTSDIKLIEAPATEQPDK